MTAGVISHAPVPEVVQVQGMLRFTGFALSGGGAKGSFQVGAAQYLIRGKGIKPDILTGTSVGAFNGLKLAEGERVPTQGAFPSGLEGLEQIWLKLRWPGQMYAPVPQLASLGVDAYNALDLLFDQTGRAIFQQFVDTGAELLALAMFLGPAGLGMLGNSPITDLVNHFLQLAQQADSLFTLDPVAGLLDGALNPILVETSGIALAMATVGLTSGALRYIRLARGLDHHGSLVGYLVERDELGAPALTASQVAAPIDMKTAILASAAAPLFYAPQRLKMSGSLAQELYTDGGVRELVPVQAALDLGARRVFAMDCNAPLTARATNWPHPGPQEPEGLVAIVPRVLATMLEEIDRDDTLAPPPERARFWHIRPRFETEGDMEIDPGAIRVNIDYGYLCAFDAVDGAVRSVSRRSLLQSLGERIAVLRRDISDRERCAEWTVRAMEYQRDKGGGEVTLQELVDALNYHRYPGDQDMDGRKNNLMTDLGLCGSSLEKGDHVLLSVGIGQAADNDLDLDLSRNRWPKAADNLSPRAAALRILQALKCQLKTLYSAREVLAGVVAVPPDRRDPTHTDAPWLRWEQSSSQRFFGDVWPGRFQCDATLDEFTMQQVIGQQVEKKGTSGWAVLANGYSDLGGRIQFLAPDGAKLRLLTGWITSSNVTPWGPPVAGEKWVTNWEELQAPADLGAPIVAASACWVSENDWPSLQVVARLKGSGTAGDTLAELSHDNGWAVVGPVVADGAPVTGVTGNPVILQAAFAQEESYELLVPIGPRIAHFHRSARYGPWTSRGPGAAYAATGTSGVPLSLACIQSNYGVPANLEAVVTIGSQPGPSTTALVALSYDAENEQWNEIGPIAPAGVDLSTIVGNPVLFQSRFGRQGDFELFVPTTQRVLHLFRDNDHGMRWGPRGVGAMYDGGATQGGGGHSPTVLRPSPVAVACWHSVYGGNLGNPDFHALLRVRSPLMQQGDGFLALRFDTRAQQWHEVGTVSLGGQPFAL